MSTEITREKVQNGLDRKKTERIRREAAMDSQERQLRLTINHNHTEKTMTEMQRREARQEEIRAQRKQREQARQAARLRDLKADAAVRYYGLSCLVTLFLAAVTRFPLWAVLALSAGLGVVLTAYIYRLYAPWEEQK